MTKRLNTGGVLARYAISWRNLLLLMAVEIPKNMNSPSSLDGRFNPRDIIAMNNCLLDISTFPA